MTPLYFGERSRRLFGLYTPAQTAGGRQRGVVLCTSWGQEYLRAHRSMRLLTSLLSAAGFHVLRFDYYGTGDSAGEMPAADLEGWRADIETAIEELKDTASLARVTLFGLRLGATLAAQVAARRRKDVDALVMWDPVVAGADYVGELRQACPAPNPRSAESGGGVELLGFPLTEAMARDIETLDLLARSSSWPARTLALLSRTRPLQDAALRTALDGLPDQKASMETIEGPPAWLEEGNSGASPVPVKLLQHAVQWLA